MYYRIKSRKVVIENNSEQSLLFCTFINQNRVFLLFRSGKFWIVDHALTSQKRVVYQENIQNQQTIIDCKRIKPNVCAIQTKKLSAIKLVKYISDQQILIGSIQTKEFQIFMNFQPKNQLLVFNNRQFAIMSRTEELNCTYFTIFNQTEQEFNYNINSKSFGDPINLEGFIIKPLSLTSQIALYKQKYTQFDKMMVFVRLHESLQNQNIDLNQILQEGDFINDIIVKSKDQYYLFILQNESSKIQIINLKVLCSNGKYTTKFQKTYTLNSENLFCMQIIEVDNKKKFYLVKSYSHLCQNGQIYDNYLEVRDLQTHKLVQKVACNIKSIDFSPSKLCLIDYSQEVSDSLDILLHIRTFFSKSYLYGYMINFSPNYKDQRIRKIHSEIINLL